MYEVAKLTGYNIRPEGTDLKIFIPGVNLQEPIEGKRMRKCGVWLEDGRHITAEQRKKIYATIRDISEYTGYLPEEQKEWLKYLYISKIGSQYFSLSTCSIDTAREFINVMIEYALQEGIILSDIALNRTDDIGKYLYHCIKYGKCAICGKPGEIHHWDAIGMGNDRTEFDDSENRKICLCREHHTEAHTIGRVNFGSKYKVFGIIIKTIDGIETYQILV